MPKLENTLFIYQKGAEHRVLDLEEAQHLENDLKSIGFVHFATIEPKSYIESLLNTNHDSDSEENYY